MNNDINEFDMIMTSTQMTADLILGCPGLDQAVEEEGRRAEQQGHGPDQGQRLLRVGDRPDGLRAHWEHNSKVPGPEKC